MVLKRSFREEDGLGLEEESKRPHTFATSVRDVMRGLYMQEFIPKLEPFLRKVVREEVEHGILAHIHSSPRPSFNQIEAPGSRGWQLHFKTRLPDTLFTGSKIESMDGTPIQIVILDANSKKIITTGPLSSIKIEIVVLDGDFGSNEEEEEWSEKEFDACVIREREGKRPLVTGEIVIPLKDGVGYLGDISFTDNSSWIRTRKFRLGAKALQSNCNAEKIREARSGAFVVKDHRGESYKKHHPPSLGDDVWRLERIGKDGVVHKRLASNRIYTVQDFLRLWVTDPCSLRSILGCGMSRKTWDAIVQHATSCILDDKRYMYYDASQQVGLLFNSIYKVIGATFDGQSFQYLENFTTFQMDLVESSIQHAYRNLKDMIEIDWPLVDVSPAALPIEDVSLPETSQYLQFSNFSITHQESRADQLTPQLGFINSTNLQPYIIEDHGPMGDVEVMQDCPPMQLFSPIRRNSFKMKGSLTTYANDGIEWVPSGSAGHVVLAGHLTGDDISRVEMQNWFPVTTSWGQGNGFVLASDDETGIGFLSSLPDLSVHMTRSCRPKMGWFKLRAAVKWGISIRRDLAARRRLLQLGY